MLCHSFENSPHDDKTYDVEKEFDLVTGKKIWVGVKKGRCLIHADRIKPCRVFALSRLPAWERSALAKLRCNI